MGEVTPDVEILVANRDAAEADAVCLDREDDVAELTEAADHLIELVSVGRSVVDSNEDVEPTTLGLVRSEADNTLVRIGSGLPELTATESATDSKQQLILTLESIGAKVKEIWNALVAALKKMWEAFKSLIAKLFDRVSTAIANLRKHKVDQTLTYVLPAVIVHKLYPKGDAAKRWKEFSKEYNAQATALRQLDTLAYTPLADGYRKGLIPGMDLNSNEDVAKREAVFSGIVNQVAKSMQKPVIAESDLLGEYSYAPNKNLSDDAPLVDRIRNLAQLNALVHNPSPTDYAAKGVEVRATGRELEEMGKVAEVLLSSYQDMSALFSDQASFSVLSTSITDFATEEGENTVRNVNAITRIVTALDQTFYQLGRVNMAYMTDIVISFTYLMTRAEPAK